MDVKKFYNIFPRRNTTWRQSTGITSSSLTTRDRFDKSFLPSLMLRLSKLVRLSVEKFSERCTLFEEGTIILGSALSNALA